MNSQVIPFEYVSILISIILGLGITQILSAYADLLYNLKRVRFYWPHSCWVVFILFLHVQDWFITYKLRDWPAWHLPELLLLLLYPIALFMVAKMLLPTNAQEEKLDMKSFYKAQYRIIFIITVICICTSMAFNLYFLKDNLVYQLPLLLFLAALSYILVMRVEHEMVHKGLALAMLFGAIVSVIYAKDVWVIN
jgi:cell division protein FtsW (lipid II flippase)